MSNQQEGSDTEKSGSHNLIAQQSNHQPAYASVAGGKYTRSYQSEAELEKQFIADLENQGYERLRLPKGADAIEKFLLKNLRVKLEELNAAKLVDGKFTDKEWSRLLRDHVLNPKHSLVDRARILREPFSFTLETGATPNLILLSPDPNENSYQVINQVENNTNDSVNRYDVTILVNGLPMVHTELKRRGVSIQEAFKQINRYRRDSFWSSGDKNRAGLYSWVQLFVGSNGTTTRYWSNTVKELSRKNQLGEDIKRTKTPGFEFTARWAHKNNKNIHDLGEFTNTFMDRRRLGRMLYDYCVVDTQDVMKVLRPYQVYAVEAGLERSRRKGPNTAGTVNAGGYFWHTTGSGKTLTSFVFARILAREQKGNSKVIFVVDRQDLDAQTTREYNTFAPGSVDSNTNTNQLQEQLLDPNRKIIVTTIQKLAMLAKRAKNDKRIAQLLSAVTKEEVTINYDECHRSQFGDSHAAIKKFFPNHRIFGFTGTPIFCDNARPGIQIERSKGEAVLATTEALFGDCLHSYTIVNAIDDKNVLKFKITTCDVGGDNPEHYERDERVKAIVEHVADNHDRLTHNRAFNSILASSSVAMAVKYFNAFSAHNKKLADLRKVAEAAGDKLALASIPKPLRIAVAYTYGANSENEQLGDMYSISEEDLDRVDNMTRSDRDSLALAMQDYNASYGTNFKLSEFSLYKDDIAQKMKSHKDAKKGDRPFEIDVLIVVNMFLTGFDAPTLNTLYADKHLYMHNLIQALSRTNRILNSQKSHGEIVCYRDLSEEVDEALRLFGQEQAGQIVLLPGYDECLQNVRAAIANVQRLGTHEEVLAFQRESDKKAFVKAWTRYLQALNTITTFSAYEDEPIGPSRLEDRDIQDYSSAYQDLYEQFLEDGEFGDEEFEDDEEGVVFDITLLKTIEVNIDYILDLVKKLINTDGDEYERKRLREDIERHLGASATLREKRELIDSFIGSLLTRSTTGGAVVEHIYGEFQTFVRDRGALRLKQVTEQHGLDLDKTIEFLDSRLAEMEFLVAGQNVIGLKLPSTKVAFGDAREVWKQAIERELEQVYNELVNVVTTVR